MKCILLNALLLLFLVVPSRGDDAKKADQLARDYFLAWENQDWPLLVAMMHPDRLEEIKEHAMRRIPKKKEMVPPEDEEEVGLALEMLQVGSPEEAWALKADVLVVRVMSSKVGNDLIKQIKLVKTDVLKTDVEEKDGDYSVLVHAVSIREEKRWRLATRFNIQKVEGQFYVSSMEVDRREEEE